MSELVNVDWTLGPAKRAMDLAGITALMPLFIPAGAVVAGSIIAIDQESPVFTQTRYGLELEPFKFYKYRTMPADTPETPSLGSGDSRRTRLGEALSSYHLDEMPQTVNIYNGTMSLVGPRAYIRQDILDTLDVLNPDEQDDWIKSRWYVKPAPFGLAQLNSHVTSYVDGENREDSLRNRALLDIEYAHTASFTTDMRIILQTAKAAFDTFAGTESDPDHLRGESGARMFTAVAEGFGINVIQQEYEWWRATLLAARCLDDIVDEQGIQDLSGHVNLLIAGKPIDGMSESEAMAFKEAYDKEPERKQAALRAIYMALPEFAVAKRQPQTLRDFLRVNNAEADIFAEMLFLDPKDTDRLRFNGWMHAFSRVGYLADFVLDSKKDYEAGVVSVRPTRTQTAWLGAQALAQSLNLLRIAPARSYAPLAKGVIKTLFN